MGNDTAANVLATIGTVCWCVQLIPQIIHNFRRKDTEGLPAAMMFIWALSALPFGVYFLLLDNSIPLEIQPQLFGTLSIVTWCQVLYYTHKYSLMKVLICGGSLFGILGGLEVLFVLTLRIPQREHNITWPRLIFGILATILFAVGFVPTYLELWRTRGRVIGIDFIFLSIDMSGALFSLISLAVQGSFDVLGGILYIIILVCELAIIFSHIIWCLCHWGIVREARQGKMTVDELMLEKEDKSAEGRGQARGDEERGEEEEQEDTATVTPGENEDDNGDATTVRGEEDQESTRMKGQRMLVHTTKDIEAGLG